MNSNEHFVLKHLLIRRDQESSHLHRKHLFRESLLGIFIIISYLVLGIKVSALYMLAKCSNPEQYLLPTPI